jgi:hypothetical protein
MISIVLLIFFSNYDLFASGRDQMEQDKYVSMTFEQVILELGTNYENIIRKIDKDYGSTPIEPPFYLYFTEEELDKSVEINVAIWKKRNYKTIIWMRLVDNEWIVFSSLKYKESIFRKF